MAFSKPVFTLSTVVLAFGIYALVEGLTSLFAAIRCWSHRDDRWLLVLEAFIGIVLGIVTLRTPSITAVILILFIAIWSLATGVLRIVEGLNLQRDIPGGSWLVIGGVASLIFAMAVLMRPTAGALAMVGILGIYALILGATEVILAFKLWRSPRRVPPSVINPSRNQAA
jgi:uncharacterized membrane protein HdeD (DUF308 family)